MRTRAPNLAVLSCLIFLSTTFEALSAPNHIWSKRFGAIGSATRGFSVATSPSGEVFLTGTFTGAVSFGGNELTGRVFLAKYDSNGNHVWSEPVGLPNSINVYAMAVDAGGNAVLTGQFSGTQNLGGEDLIAVGSADLYIAKFDEDGNHVWSRSVGTLTEDVGLAVAIDNDENVLVTGFVHRFAANIIVVKYGAAGSLLWSKELGGAQHDEGLSIATDASGGVIVAGSFLDTVNFGGSQDLVSDGQADIFLAKYDSGGGHQWSKRFGGIGYDACFSLATDAEGSVFTTGNFQGVVSFGGDEFTSNGDDVDAFVAKYDSDGQHLWSHGFGGPSYEYGYHLDVDDWGNVHIIGSFTQTINAGGNDLFSAGATDAFVASYGGNGQHIWSQSFGDTGYDAGQSIDADVAGNLLITGYFDGSVDFGGGPLSSVGSPDAYFAKFGSVMTGIGRAPNRTLSISASPNPFNPSTMIRYELPLPGHVAISIYDVRGLLIATLVDEEKAAGWHQAQWRGKNQSGQIVSSGVYFVGIEHEDERRAIKLVLLK